MYFFKVGRKYRVVTRPQDGNQIPKVQNMTHYFNYGEVVTCTKVFGPNHPMNYRNKLVGEFVDSNGLPQELLAADVEVIHA